MDTHNGKYQSEVILDDVSTPMTYPYQCHIHKQASMQASYISPVLDGAAVGMEVTAAEGAPDDIGIAVDNAMQCQSF